MSYKFMQTKVKSSFIFFAEGLELIRKTEDDKHVCSEMLRAGQECGQRHRM